MPSRFDESLGAAVALLRELPRGRAEVDEARRRLSAFRAANAPLRTDLVVDRPPASTAVDYDLLIEHPEGGTIAMSWRSDDGTPWLVDYSDHWAANYVVSVGEHHITIEQALQALRLRRRHEPGLMEELLREAVIARALAEDPPDVSAEELQLAADEFRSANRLFDAASTHRWLTAMGLSVESFRAMLRGGVQAMKLKERVTARQVERYVNEHHAALERVSYLRVSFASAAAAREAVDDAHAGGGLVAVVSWLSRYGGSADARGTFATEAASDLAPVLAAAASGVIVGPVSDGARHWIAEVIRRTPATCDDAATRRVAQERLFQEWVDGECARAGVRWHWM